MSIESVEKFRPTALQAMVGQNDARQILSGMIASGKNGKTFPHILMHGPPGVGKTTAALAVGRELLGTAWRDNFLELNASDERGIDVVRERIKPYVGQMPMGAVPFKFLFLDEVDQMTTDAQQALRRIMEQSGRTTRFLLACNSINKVTDAIQSRCAVIGFRPLTEDHLRVILAEATTLEGLPMDNARINSIVAHCRGDARKAINMLIMGGIEADAYVRLDAEIKKLFTTPSQASVEQFLSFLRTEGISEWEEVLGSIGEFVVRYEAMSQEKRIAIITQIGTAAFRCTMVSAPILQIRSFLYGAVL